MPSPTDFNVSPYYDDYAESKNFHRILFRPAFAVQARELTQAQTVTQNQINKFGDHVFKNGAMVIPGQVSIDTNYYAVKLTSKSAASVSTYEGTTITGGTSGVIAYVVGSVATDGTDPDTLFVKYNKTGTDNVDLVFADGETITSDGAGSPTCVVNTTATGSAAGIQAGTYYINGYFVEVASATLVLDNYTNTPTYRIGLTVTESFVAPGDDSSLNDNATGSSNQNAPGAHRFKILLTLAKKTTSATDDTNFIEIARVVNGVIKSHIRTTEYAILEETLARRTHDESGDYVLSNPDFDVRESLISGTNRGIFSAGSTDDGNTAAESLLAIGVSPFKAYVKGFEVERIGTTYVDVEKAREFDTANNNKTRFDLYNYVNVNNVYGSPDIGFVSGDVAAFKTVQLYDTATAVRGTQQSTSGNTTPQIGRAKSRGMEFTTGTEAADIYTADETTVMRNYLFDVEMYTHLKLTTATTFTTGEKVSGATSGATGNVLSISAGTTQVITGATQANPGVITSTSHGFKSGDAVYFIGVAGMTELNSNTYYIKKASANTFTLHDSAGVDINTSGFGAYTSSGTVAAATLVVYNVDGTFQAGEVITGATSSNSATTKANLFGNQAAQVKEFGQVKQIGMAGSPTYTADTDLTNTYSDHFELTGNVSVANSDATLNGKGTQFTTQLKPGDQIQFTDDANSTVTGIIDRIESNTLAELTANVGGSDVTTAGIVTRTRTKLQGADKNISLFKLPYVTVKTLKTTSNSGQSDTNFNVRRNFTATLSSNGDATITAGTNEIFAAQNDSDFTVTIMTTGAGSTGAVGDVVNTSGNNHEGDGIFNLGGSPTGKTLTLDFGANFNGHKVKILATIARTVANSKTKTLNSDSTVNITSQAIIESGTIGLSKADIYALSNVYMSSGFGATASASDTDITNRFNLDNGQRDNFYDIGRIKLKPGAIVPTGQLFVKFDYFSHGSGDYFDVDSYSGIVTYSNIPSYTSDTTGDKYELRDCIDLRPRVDDASTINSGGTEDRSYDGTGASTIDVVEFGTDVTGDLEYYLSRIDKLFITREGALKVLKGASALNPLEPGEFDDHLLLATLEIPSYTLNTDEVIIEKEDNKRFTMRDIGRLENRIKNIEYYTQLSLLEADAQGLQIQDSDGFDRFKNGFVVDNFTGHNVGDVGNNDYKLAIDRGRGEARTLFNEDIVELEEVDDDGSAIVAADRTAAGYATTGDLITLPYTETIVVQQPYATGTENLNPFLIFDWIGNIDLDPPLDEWKETTVAPEIVANVNGTFDNLARERGLDNTTTSEIPVGTEWNEWQDQWTGNPRTNTTQGGNQRITTTDVDVTQTRSGIRTVIVPLSVRQSLGNRVISVAFVPFIRSRTVTFEGFGLRPNTRVYPFFDEQAVAAYVTPDGGALAGNLNTDANGYIKGTFAIPDPNDTSKPRWRTGKRVFRLTSSSTNTKTASNIATSAEADYDAKGLLETVQEAIISTRETQTVRQDVSGNRTTTRTVSRTVENIGGGGDGGEQQAADPLAQTFMINEEDGVFITSVNAYFSTKSATIPVKAEIRNVVNGYPGEKLLPFGRKWLNPSSVNTSTDGSTATTFTFPSPVYLREGVEYCLVLYSDSSDYSAYIARLGSTTLDSSRTVSKQPAVGVLFKSANNTSWSAEQFEDLKFDLNKAVFTTNTTGTVTLANKATSTSATKILASNPIRTFSGTTNIRVYHKNHGMHITTDNVTISGLSAGSYNGIAHSNINGTYTGISNITLDSYDVTAGEAASSTGDVGGAEVLTTQNRLFDVCQLQIGHVTHPGTTVTSTLRTTTGRSVHGSETPFSLLSAASAKSVVLGDNIFFTEPQVVASTINQTNEMSGNQSMFVNVSMITTNANVSPIIDLKRINAICVSNRLNNPTVSSTDTFTGDGSTVGFTLSGSPTSVHLLSIKKNGDKLAPVTDFTVSGSTLTMVSAPASGSKVVAKITNTVDYEDDTAVEGGSSAGSYIIKPVNLTNASTALDIRVAASVRSSSSIRAYYKISGGDETRRIEDIPYTAFNTDGTSDSSVVPSTGDQVLDLDFKDYKFSVSNLPEFTSFQTKIVFKGTNSSYTARLKDYRCIALAV